MDKVIKIGTRNSKLALWQAKEVSRKLEQLGYKTSLVPICTNGDNDKTQPLYKMGIQGIFTKALDTALLNKEIDIAVHSLKDVPTDLPEGIVTYAILERGNPFDLLVFKQPPKENEPYIIGTSSLRRKQQWLNRFPNHTSTNLRGNVTSRLDKLSKEPIDGTIIAAAGLERINLIPKNSQVLNWMIPAPAQGALVILGLDDNPYKKTINKLNHHETEVCTEMERYFLKTLEAGCTAPVGAYAQISKSTVTFKGILLGTEDASKKIEIYESFPVKMVKEKSHTLAQKVLDEKSFQ